MAEPGQSENVPQIKVSKRPAIQQKVETQRDLLQKRDPTRTPESLNTQAREKVATALSKERLREEVKKEREYGYIDKLTGLPNRRAFDERFKTESARAKRNGTLGLVLIDVNFLKQLNDSPGGYPAGDELLKRVAKVLQEATREADFVSRWGGDEYGVILSKTNGQEGIQLWWERVQEGLIRENISLGAGAVIVNPENPQQSFQEATNALHDAKIESKDPSNLHKIALATANK